MKSHLTKIYFEVRTKGDGEWDWFSVPATSEGEKRYDNQSLDSTTKYAKEIGGFVVKVTETTIDTFETP